MKLHDGRIQCDADTCTQTHQPWDATWFLCWEAAGTFYQKLWNEELARWPMVLHVCSLRCASQAHDLWMQEQIRKQRLFARNNGGMELIQGRTR